MENETFEQVCAEMRSFGNVPPPMFAWRDLAERAETAHKCEMAAKDAERIAVAANYESVIAAKDRIIDVRDRVIAAKDRVIAARDRVIAARDAEISDLATKCSDAINDLIQREEMIEQRDALIRELADALEPFPKRNCILCKRYIHGECTAVKEDRCSPSNIQELVAKAREVVAKIETTTEDGK